MFCSKCGTEIDDQACFCSVCGTKVNATTDKPKSQIATPGIGAAISNKPMFAIALAIAMILCILIFPLANITENTTSHPDVYQYKFTGEIDMPNEHATEFVEDLRTVTTLNFMGIVACAVFAVIKLLQKSYRPAFSFALISVIILVFHQIACISTLSGMNSYYSASSGFGFYLALVFGLLMTFIVRLLGKEMKKSA